MVNKEGHRGKGCGPDHGPKIAVRAPVVDQGRRKSCRQLQKKSVTGYPDFGGPRSHAGGPVRRMLRSFT